MMATMLLRVSLRFYVRGEGRKGKGHLHEIGEDDGVLEGLRHPDQVQRVLVDVDLLGQGRRVVGAQEAAAVRRDADAEVADPHFELCAADDVGDGGGDARVDLRGRVGRVVGLVVQRDEEDARNEW